MDPDTEVEETVEAVRALDARLIPAYQVPRIIQPLDPKQAIKFFAWVGEQDGYKHSVKSYSAIIRKLGKQPKKTEAIVAQARANKIVFDGTLYSEIVLAYVEAGDVELAWAEHLNMEAEKKELNPNAYVSLVFFLERKGKGPWMLQAATYPPITYLSLKFTVKAYCYLKRYSDAEKIFRKIVSYMAPDKELFQFFINSFADDNQPVVAERWIWKMLLPRYNKVPNVVDFTQVMSSYLRTGNFAGARGVLTWMRNRRIPPSAITIATLLRNPDAQVLPLLVEFAPAWHLVRTEGHLRLQQAASLVPGHNDKQQHDARQLLVDAVVDALHKGSEDDKIRADLVWDQAVRLKVFAVLLRESEPDPKIDLHGLSVGSALVALSRSILQLRSTILPQHSLEIVTGKGNHSAVQGISPVQIAVGELLREASIPFHEGVGVYVCTGSAVIQWLATIQA